MITPPMLSSLIFCLLNSLASVFLVFFMLETIADEQHWQFQTLKHSLTPEARSSHSNQEIVDGFYQSGDIFLFYSLPCSDLALRSFSILSTSKLLRRASEELYFSNVFPRECVCMVSPCGSQCISSLALASDWLTGQALVMFSTFTDYLVTVIAGAAQLILLFMGSMDFAEDITSSK